MKTIVPTLKTAQISASSAISVGCDMLSNLFTKIDLQPKQSVAMFPLNACKKEMSESYSVELTTLTCTVMSFLFELSCVGSMSSMDTFTDKIIDIVKNKGIQKETITVDNYTWAQGILNDYMHSSVSFCSIYSWIHSGKVKLSDVKHMLSLTYKILAYATISQHICTGLTCMFTCMDLNWKPNLNIANLAHVYVHDRQLDTMCHYSVDRAIFQTDMVTKGGWARCILDTQKGNIPENMSFLAKALKEIVGIVWPEIIDCIAGDIKHKRFLCNAICALNSDKTLTVKEINTLIREELQPLTVEILHEVQSMLGDAKLNITAEEKKEPIATFSPVNTIPAFDPTAFEKVEDLLDARVRDITDELLEMKRKYIAEHTKVKKLSEANNLLTKELQKQLQKAEDADTATVARLRQQLEEERQSLAEARQQIRDLTLQPMERDAKTLHHALEKQAETEQKYADLQQQYTDLQQQYASLAEEFEEVIKQQQNAAALEEEIPESRALSVSELELLSKIHVHGIIPDLKSLRRLKELMPNSRLVEVGQNCTLSTEVPPGYEMYFFITSLSGHKVYNKWRSYVDRYGAAKLHCSVTGFNTVARQIIKAYLSYQNGD